MKTLESIFINEFEALQNDLYEARKRIKELENKEEEVKQEKVEEPVFFKTISKEVCLLEVARSYAMNDSSIFKNLTSSEVKEIVDDSELLKEYANKNNDYYYDKKPFVYVRKDVFPYTANIQGEVVLLDIYHSSSGYDTRCNIMRSANNLCENKYFDIKQKDKLYEYGLEKFKQELNELYERKLKNEGVDND